MIDAHSWWRMGDKSYSTETVTELSRENRKVQSTWLEVADSPDDHDAYRKLCGEQKIPAIATRRTRAGGGRFLRPHRKPARRITSRWMSVLGGGPGGAVFAPPNGQRVFAAVQKKNLRFAFHSWEPRSKFWPLRISEYAGRQTSSSGSNIPSTPSPVVP